MVDKKQVELYSLKELEKIKRACDVVVEVLEEVAKHVKPGVSTYELDLIARDVVKSRGARAAFLNYKPSFSKTPYPAALCVSVNAAVVHGLPKKDIILQEGDLVSLDFGAILDGYAGDSAITVPVGEVSEDKKRLLEATKEALEEAVRACVPGNWLSDITKAIKRVADKYGVHPVKNLGGHGIGRKVHEPPFVPNNLEDFKHERDMKLRAGMVLAIEPMLALGTTDIAHDGDQWTVLTADGSPSAHYEYVVAITKEGPMVLTQFREVFPDA
ncbi:type I methionyl aminopeptidase [Thermocrinis sp.]|uniref:type I methionyl aminopeptidase n=1 Tax=Thermocrinis sp. TaxID=2024383 RepID=UPI002FDF0036